MCKRNWGTPVLDKGEEAGVHREPAPYDCHADAILWGKVRKEESWLQWGLREVSPTEGVSPCTELSKFSDLLEQAWINASNICSQWLGALRSRSGWIQRYSSWAVIQLHKPPTLWTNSLYFPVLMTYLLQMLSVRGFLSYWSCFKNIGTFDPSMPSTQHIGCLAELFAE